MMREFFRGWRRKVGLLTLVMACICMAGWVRSLKHTDTCFFSIGSIWYAGFVSNHGQFSLGVAKLPDDIPFRFRYSSYEHSQPVRIETVALMFDFIGPATHKNYNQRKSQTIISYWFVVIPLTLISSYLLLIKPRNSTPMKTAEPIAVEEK